MSAYNPIILAGTFDGDEVNENFDLYQKATCDLDAANFVNTTDLGFRHFHTGASTETLVENGDGKVMLFPAWMQSGAGGINPYNDYRLDKFSHAVSDTEVSFVAREDGVAVVNSYVDLYRAKCVWLEDVGAVPRYNFIELGAFLGYRSGLATPTSAVLWDIYSKNLDDRSMSWTTGEPADEMCGNTIRVRGSFPVHGGVRYSTWMTISFDGTCTIDSWYGTHSLIAAAANDPGLLVTDSNWLPDKGLLTTFYGRSRQTSVTCIYG